MKERMYVKLRSDMYSDTKFKIIDTKPERDTIHYVWTRLLTLAAKVNLAGDLYMSRNIPHTIETLSIEFNRSEEQIKLALEVFIELEMLELIDGKIYRVKNFAKHQNIKVDEKVKSENKDNELKNTEAVIKEASPSEIYNSEIYNNEVKNLDTEDKESESKVAQKEITPIKNDDKGNQEIIKDNNMSSKIIDNSVNDNIPISLEIRKNKKGKGKKKKEELFNITDEEDIEDSEIISLTEGERPLCEGERVIFNMTFDSEGTDKFIEEKFC